LNGGDSDYFRVKVYPLIVTKKGTAKYLQPARTMNHVYCPLGVNPQGKETLYITEGEKKALCLALNGFSCIGLGGVNGYRTKDAEGNSRIIPDFDLINWNKRDVVIVFDADIEINDKVAQAEAKLAEELLARKARVFIKRLPYGPGCAKGADDFISAHGADAFKKLPTRPVKPKPAQTQGTELETVEAPRVPMCGHLYFVDRGRLCLEGVDREGKPRFTPLANFTAQITDEIDRDDGLTVTKEFLIAGKMNTGKPFTPARIQAKDFDSMKWVRDVWGAEASIAPARTQALHMPNAILAFSQERIQKRTIYTHTGWREVNGVFRYLHGGGGIGQGPEVTVDLGDNLKLFRLPAPGGVEAAQASLRVLDIGPWVVMAPIISCVYLAPLASLLKVDFSLWIYGHTGNFKSTLAALAQAHFGLFSRTTLPGSWFSTANSLERLTFILKDTVCVIDDFNPPPNQKEAHAMAEKAGRIIYQAGNLSGRGRLDQKLNLRPNYYPRGLIISTGETLLPGQRQSATARYLGIEPKKAEIDMARLTAAQGEAHLYSQAMAAYLEHLAPLLDDTLAEIQDLWKGYRTAFQSGAHLRIPEIQAWLAVGFELFLRFQARMGAISEDQSYEMLKQAWKVFEALGEKHSRIIEGDRPVVKFMDTLRELFFQGKIYAEDVHGGHPQRWQLLGWEIVNPEASEPKYAPIRNAELVGWVDQSHLYLLPEATVRGVKDAIRRQGDYLSLGKNDLLAALARENIIEPLKGENSRLKKILGDPRRVIFLKWERFQDNTVEDNT
jgi:hypothetical protein